MADITDIVIVGGGLAAAKAVEAIRDEGFDGRVTLFGDEPVRPYERPPLSKGYLVGDAAEETVFVHPASYYDEHRIELRLDTTVTEIDRDAGEVVTGDGARQRFDRLVLATGAEPRALPGPRLDGVHLLRTKANSEQLGAAISGASRVAIIGAGWIGCEVASAARRLGADVTMIDPLDVPLQRVLGTEVGAVFRDLHVDNGVDLRLGVGLESMLGNTAVEGISLTDGATVEADVVVVGIGVVPRVGLAEAAGLRVDNGVLTDATLQSSDPRIFAAGDIARAEHPLYDTPLRVEHWANALNQGATAGRNTVGRGEVYDRVPYFYSDQYDLGMEYVGFATEWDEVVFRGDPASREFIAFWVTDKRVVAAMNCNVWDVVEDLKAIITSQQPVDAAALRDPNVPLASLAASA